MDEYFELTGRRYDFLRSFRMDDAQYAFVGLGSMMETAEATVDYLRAPGLRIGCVSVTAFRPFPFEELASVFGRCRAIRYWSG